MPTPLRRRGSGLLQNPRPGMLPSPVSPSLDPLGPLRDRFSTRQSSGSLRPAALFHLPSAPPLSGHRRFHYRAPLAAYPGRIFTGWSPRPSWAVRETTSLVLRIGPNAGNGTLSVGGPRRVARV